METVADMVVGALEVVAEAERGPPNYPPTHAWGSATLASLRRPLAALTVVASAPVKAQRMGRCGRRGVCWPIRSAIGRGGRAGQAPSGPCDPGSLVTCGTARESVM